ncbi:MAG TPA: polyribonucleotide nucleotidyltransferase [Cryomorphaceae bacterium]|jgi:polyribonucleotide nucleotidyltransferase|nr:MAG: polyribonucleotide nucleotidyltransferase [Cryomorphaceae bacterium BACL7 MAG-120910-bin2]KRO69719.1 MAG: polyribonucleotide nucleotidyltransferase [Cryomorphaceae bacterium BACL7 MAG-120322-bin74]KRO83477.1 MAG: polyribonucleotide nucleotidyltransferase [Cryomorphaceae bacterium BACL7 MAG-121220-bin83]HAB32160.1 polyribonucleotide nucleotidyltransferase [Cryomorphaceae bacterium]
MKAPTPISQSLTLPDGRVITLETGRMARQADGAVLLTCGGTALLATVVANKDARPGVDFLPLSVEYKEKFAGAGRVPGGFLKREGRPSDREVLVCRLVDRVLRPLFPDDFHAEIQVIITMLSFDPATAPESLAGLAASAAISISNIPFNGPMSEVNIARVNGEFVINPSYAQLEVADMEIMVGATADSVVMVEGEMKEVSEDEMLEAIQIGHNAIKEQVALQSALAAMVPSAMPKREYSHETHDEDLRKHVEAATYEGAYKVAGLGLPNKAERSAQFKAVFEAYVETLSDEQKASSLDLAKVYFHDVEYKAMRNQILDNGIRLDGRKTDEIRPIWVETDVLPGPHGCALFTRGETQSFTTVTLGTALDSNRIDAATMTGDEKFYLHYNFPPFSTGEARMMRGTSRREVGHGNLAQRALKNMVPQGSGYTIRIVSDILESNGSSSMATVCAGTLALMDAGIQIERPVSGIAMGLITDPESGKYAVLSDILGDEDHLGDMDFKVTGTEKGITACQMDIKIKGLSFEILKNALNQANAGRAHILNVMTSAVPASRAELKPHAPRMVVLEVPKSFIGGIIGPGGKIIQGMQAETGTTITIEEVGNIGRVEISGTNAEGIALAQQRINEICFVPLVDTVYKGVVKGVQTFGVFVEIGRGTEGLLHVSEMDWKRVEDPSALYKEGDKVEVKLLSIDDKGKLRLSRKVLLEKPEGYVERAPREDRGPRHDHGDRGPRPERGERRERGPRNEE